MSTSTTATPSSAPRSGTKTTWKIDPAHSHVGFGIKHLMIATVRGRFAEVQGTVTVQENDPTTAEIDIAIPTASVTTADEKRDAHLRSADFFDAERFPTMTFRSKGVKDASKETFQVFGDLTIRDVTRQVVLEVEMLGHAKDPWGQEHAAFEATTKIRRGDYGLTWNAALETGGVLVGDEVKISIEAQLLKQA